MRRALFVLVPWIVLGEAAAAATLFLAEHALPGWLAFAYFLGIFPAAFATVRIFGGPFADWRSFEAAAGKRGARVYIAIFIANATLAASAFPPLWKGQPESRNGAFLQNSHGALTRVTRGQFERARLAEQRGAFAIASVFYAWTALALFRRSGGNQLAP